MHRRIVFLRISYWVGAIIDIIFIIPMLFPTLGGKLFGIEDFNPGGEYRYAMGVASALMLGWAVLLLWADQKPLERRFVLLLTIVPVKVCLDLANIYLLQYGITTVVKMIPALIESSLLYVLFAYAYIYSRPLAKKKNICD